MYHPSIFSRLYYVSANVRAKREEKKRNLKFSISKKKQKFSIEKIKKYEEFCKLYVTVGFFHSMLRQRRRRENQKFLLFDFDVLREIAQSTIRIERGAFTCRRTHEKRNLKVKT